MKPNSLKRSIPAIQSIRQVYKGAVTSDGRFVSISDITEENRNNTSYTCLGCGKRLYPVLGEKRSHHFRHEKDSECSDYNRYLHEYAKAELKRRFDEGDSFIIKYNASFKCRNFENCTVRNGHNWRYCSYCDTCTRDLKRTYDTCTPEKGYYEDTPDGKKRYIADLKLTSTKEDVQPLTLEIWVNHECTKQKRNSGTMIIEIKIEKEEDACREIQETADGDEKPILFHGFDRNIIIPPLYVFRHLKVMPGIYSKVVVMTESSCSEKVEFDKDSNCSYEIIISNTSRGNLKPKICEKALACFFPALRIRELCSHYMITSRGIMCRKGNSRYNCPCDSYTLNTEEKNKFLHTLARHDVEIWTSNNK